LHITLERYSLGKLVPVRSLKRLVTRNVEQRSCATPM
jgi:hypothetical protein